MYQFIQVHEGENTEEFLVQSGTKLSIVVVAVGVGHARVTIRVRLVGRGASALVTGIVIAGGHQNVLLHIIQSHEAPETTSNLLVKTVISGHAQCLFTGTIRVARAAQKTDAYQRNENLLLSDNASAVSKPLLEILADDVRCTHGATAGPVNQEELWYLISRGIPPAKAITLITRGFIQSAIDRVEDKNIKNSIMSLCQSL